MLNMYVTYVSPLSIYCTLAIYKYVHSYQTEKMLQQRQRKNTFYIFASQLICFTAEIFALLLQKHFSR